MPVQSTFEIVEDVEVEGVLGLARVFEDEYEAEEARNEWFPRATLICYGGYFNTVWSPYARSRICNLWRSLWTWIRRTFNRRRDL